MPINSKRLIYRRMRRDGISWADAIRELRVDHGMTWTEANDLLNRDPRPMWQTIALWVTVAATLSAAAWWSRQAWSAELDPCEREIRESCPHARGPVAVARCLRENLPELHPECYEAVTHPERSE